QLFPPKTENSLDLVANLRRTDLEIIEPFVNTLFSNLRGNAEGKLNIQGTLKDPLVLGKIKIQNAQLTLDYLNTTYDLEGDVYFRKNVIGTDNAILFDALSNPATLEAKVFHDGFKNLHLQLRSDFYDFQLLNTSAQDNELFYGTAYATGNLTISGYLSNLKMDINARSKKGTRISLPLDGYEEVSERDYIHFVKLTPGGEDNSLVEKIDLGGLELNFNLDITPDAIFEIIFDYKAGDIIRGTGNGNIEMFVSTKGDFEIYGFYVIQEGRYNFTFANLVNKGFSIQPGSRIAFNGDIYQSELDIQAIYTRNVALRPLIDLDAVVDSENPEYRRPYEVSALMELKGDLLSPEIKLGLDLDEAKKTSNPYLQTAVYQLDTKIKTDEQELNRQVFSLLILGSISPLNSFRVGVGVSAGSSLSELLSNQFSNWISQVDENLELSFDLDANDFNTLQLRVSYSLLDGRLRISRDGGFINAQNQADFASIVGDWTVEYLLTPGGKYRIKMYNRTNQSIINRLNLSNPTTTTAGFSFQYTANFNNLGELFQSNRRREELEKEKIRQNTPEEQADYLRFEPKFNPDRPPAVDSVSTPEFPCPTCRMRKTF
ncbi:MAG: translocation/assembly module TamB, partial [Bacteroidia bacterium]|nr:translocation/assembly module TamB [Bacteroidia bacterium]